MLSEERINSIYECTPLKEGATFRGEFARAIETAVIAQAINDTLHAVRKCEQRSGTCFMVHSILNKEHPDVCDAKNCNSIRAMKVPT